MPANKREKEKNKQTKCKKILTFGENNAIMFLTKFNNYFEEQMSYSRKRKFLKSIALWSIIVTTIVTIIDRVIDRIGDIGGLEWAFIIVWTLAALFSMCYALFEKTENKKLKPVYLWCLLITTIGTVIDSFSSETDNAFWHWIFIIIILICALYLVLYDNNKKE